MNCPKYDVFVFSRKLQNIELNLRAEPIMLKLYQMLRQRLNEQGFGNAVFDTQCYMPVVELTREEITSLIINPVFLSEHFLGRHYAMTTQREAVRVFQAPWRTKPSMDAYAYVNRGKAPIFHAMFIGECNSGKTYVLNEFKLMLRDIDPGIEVIECDNDIKQPDHWDITTDPTEYAAYKERVKAKGILIGGGPSYTLGVDDVVYHNTKI
jgi:hypothetical protein